MAVYSAPGGFLLDESTGLYLRETIVTDSAGAKYKNKMFFNADTGEYSQVNEPVVPAAPPVRPPVQQPAVQPQSVQQPVVPAAPPVQQPVRQPQIQPQQIQPQVQQAPVYRQPVQQYYAPPVKKKSKAPAVIAIVLAVLALGVGLVFGAKYLIGKMGDRDTKPVTFAKDKDTKAPEIDDTPAVSIVDKSVDTDEARKETGTGNSSESYYSPEESYDYASSLIGYIGSTSFIDAGERYDLTQLNDRNYTTDFQPYTYYFEFNDYGDVTYWYASYVDPKYAAVYDYDHDIDQTGYEGIETIDKWMEGRSTACVKFSVKGYTITLKMDFDTKLVHLVLDDVSASADNNCLLGHVDGGEGEFYTPEDIAKIKEQLGMD